MRHGRRMYYCFQNKVNTGHSGHSWRPMLLFNATYLKMKRPRARIQNTITRSMQCCRRTGSISIRPTTNALRAGQVRKASGRAGGRTKSGGRAAGRRDGRPAGWEDGWAGGRTGGLGTHPSSLWNTHFFLFRIAQSWPPS